MSVVINVFYRQRPYEASFIQNLIDYNFVHYVDTTRFNDPVWLNENTKFGEIYRYYNDEVTIVDGDYVELLKEDGVFVLISDVDKFVPNMEEFVYLVGSGKIGHESERFLKLMRMGGYQVYKPIEQSKKRNVDDTQKEPDQQYTFTFRKVGDNTYYQFTKPNTDLPYVIALFGDVPKERIFSSMGKFDSWGVGKNDYPFLAKVWKNLGFECELNSEIFEELLMDHYKAINRGETDTKIWRNTINSVIENQMIKSKK